MNRKQIVHAWELPDAAAAEPAKEVRAPPQGRGWRGRRRSLEPSSAEGQQGTVAPLELQHENAPPTPNGGKLSILGAASAANSAPQAIPQRDKSSRETAEERLSSVDSQLSRSHDPQFTPRSAAERLGLPINHLSSAKPRAPRLHQPGTSPGRPADERLYANSNLSHPTTSSKAGTEDPMAARVEKPRSILDRLGPPVARNPLTPDSTSSSPSPSPNTRIETETAPPVRAKGPSILGAALEKQRTEAAATTPRAPMPDTQNPTGYGVGHHQRDSGDRKFATPRRGRGPRPSQDKSVESEKRNREEKGINNVNVVKPLAEMEKGEKESEPLSFAPISGSWADLDDDE